jgi:hypothetical protein
MLQLQRPTGGDCCPFGQLGHVRLAGPTATIDPLDFVEHHLVSGSLRAGHESQQFVVSWSAPLHIIAAKVTDNLSPCVIQRATVNVMQGPISYLRLPS